jgi:hypothetical protein
MPEATTILHLMPLALNARDAAKCVGLSEKTLWNHTQPRGDLRCVRVGERVLYRPADLEAWLMGHVAPVSAPFAAAAVGNLKESGGCSSPPSPTLRIGAREGAA